MPALEGRSLCWQTQELEFHSRANSSARGVADDREDELKKRKSRPLGDVYSSRRLQTKLTALIDALSGVRPHGAKRSSRALDELTPAVHVGSIKAINAVACSIGFGARRTGLAQRAESVCDHPGQTSEAAR